VTSQVLSGTTTDIAPLLPIAVGAVFAALGYVGKIIVETWQQWRARKAALHAQLLRLQALLSASRAAFDTQAELRDRLESDLARIHRVDRVTGGS
jgi:hypothetical protein